MEYPRSSRETINGEVIIKRPDKPTLKAKQGNVSDGGLFVKLTNMIYRKVVVWKSL